MEENTVSDLSEYFHHFFGSSIGEYKNGKQEIEILAPPHIIQRVIDKFRELPEVKDKFVNLFKEDLTKKLGPVTDVHFSVREDALFRSLFLNYNGSPYPTPHHKELSTRTKVLHQVLSESADHIKSLYEFIIKNFDDYDFERRDIEENEYLDAFDDYDDFKEFQLETLEEESQEQLNFLNQLKTQIENNSIDTLDKEDMITWGSDGFFFLKDKRGSPRLVITHPR